MQLEDTAGISAARNGYVRGSRALRPVAERVGLIGWSDRRRENNPTGLGAHVGTLFAAYDVEEIARRDLPWWTYPAARQVDWFLAGRRDARVFEFGSGASTLWLARRAGAVVSVEHDSGFAEVVRGLLAREPECAARVELHVVPAEPLQSGVGAVTSARAPGLDFRRYRDTIKEVGGEFDVIVIDGRAREACLEAAVDHLADGGVIVYDDSYRGRYRRAIDASGLRAGHQVGLVPTLPYPSSTALLRKR